MSDVEKKLEAALRKSLVELKKAQIKLDSIERSQHEPIAIIGMSCRFPAGANDPESYWELLSKGHDGISEVPKDRWDINEFYDPDPDAMGKIITRKGGFIDHIDLFDAEFFRISHREAQSMDPQQRILLEVTWEALERAGIAPSSLENSLTGVFIGASYSDHSALIQRAQLDQLGTYSALSISLSALNGRISYCLGLLGPSMTVDTACSSSLTSLHLACGSLQRGECNVAITGGVYIMISPAVFIMLSRAKMLSPDGHCKTFDASGDGYARGEGAGIVILKRLSDAVRDRDNILAIIRASSVNQDGPSSGLTVPNRVSQVKLMEKALNDAKLKSTDVSYIEAHGTGTELGDPIEVGAIKDVYGKERSAPLLLGSVKSNIGHLEGAAGIAGLIKIVLSLNHETIPPNLHFKNLNPKINLDAIPGKVVDKLTPWKYQENMPRRAAISAFGFTGSNAHVVIEEPPTYPRKKPSKEDRPIHIFTLSAKTENALNTLKDEYLKYLGVTNHAIGDICYTANTGRNHERYRLAVIAKDIDELKLKLTQASYTQAKEIDIQPQIIKFTGDWTAYLTELSAAYLSGADIDWVKFDETYGRSKVVLPAYPFQRVKFPIIGAIRGVDKQIVSPDLFYEWNWENHDFGVTHKAESLGHWLVLSNGNIPESVINVFNKNGGSYRHISLTDINNSKESFAGLLKQEKIDGILHISSGGGLNELNLKNIQNAQMIGVKSVLSLTQALIQLQDILKIPLIVITAEDVVNGTLQGLFKTIVSEHPELVMKLIYVESNCNPNLLFNAIVDNSDEIIFKIDNVNSYVPRMKKLMNVSEGKLNIRSDSSYLITGALGELGLFLAKWLAEQGAGRIILTGRRQPDQDVLKDLRKSEAEVIYELLDISNESAVQTLLHRHNISDKPLKGIFHLAGVLDDATFLELSWTRFEKVFSSKLYGSYYLHTHSKDLDYFILFSSLASTLGSPGQANYAAACSFMDALAEHRRMNGLPALSISWGPWAEIGMAKNLVLRHSRAGLMGIKPKDGMLALEKAMTLPQAHLTIANMEWSKYINHIIKPAPWIQSFATKQALHYDLLRDLKNISANEQPIFIKNFVTEIVRDVFGTPESQSIDANMGFFDMGIDSLMAIEIKNRLQAALGVDVILDNVAIFNHPSIEAMTKHLIALLNLDLHIDQASSEEVKRETIINAVDEMSIDDVIKKLRGEKDGE